MKPLYRSHIIWTLLAILGGYLTIVLRKYLPAELAKVVSDELVASVGTALCSYGLLRRTKDKLAYEKAEDARKDAAATKAAARHKAGKETK